LHFVTGDAVVLDEVVAGGGGVLGAAGQIDAGFENLGIGGAVIAAEAGGVFVAVGGVQAEQAVAGDGMAGTDDEDAAVERTVDKVSTSGCFGNACPGSSCSW